MITSNASFTDSFWYDITTHLHNLHWTVSVDRVGNSAKIVRHGSDWSVIEHNVSWLAQHATSLNINSVVSNLSVFGLRPLLEFGHKMQGLSMPPTGRHGSQGCRHQFFVCQRPYWLAADNWPDSTKTKLLEYLAQCQNLDLDQEQANMLNNLINQIQNSTFDEQLWARNLEYNSLLDAARGEDHLQLYEPQVF